jgi:hypothetical protein
LLIVEDEDRVPVDRPPQFLHGDLVDRLAQIEPADFGADMGMQLACRKRHRQVLPQSTSSVMRQDRSAITGLSIDAPPRMFAEAFANEDAAGTAAGDRGVR